MGKAYLAKLSSWGGLVVFVIALGLPTFAVQAGETASKGRTTYHCTKQEFVEVSDVPDHWIGVIECEGIVFRESGEVGTYKFWGTGDYVKGTGPAEGYGIATYEDGSTYTDKWQDVLTAGDEGKSASLTGTYQFINGTGRFAGIKGEGTFTGQSFGGKGYVDWSDFYTLPD